MRHLTRLLYLLTLCLVHSRVWAETTLSPWFADDMLIQRNAPFVVKGQDDPGIKVEVRLNHALYQALAGKDGHWQVTVPAQKASSSNTLEISGSTSHVFKQVAFGDLYLASGQSNMELPVNRVLKKYPDILKAQVFADVRLFQVPRHFDFTHPHKDYAKGKWLRADQQTLGQFSAVAWFFAEELHKRTKVPIGVISAAVGGSPVEAWMSETALQGYPVPLAELKKFRQPGVIEAIQTADRQRIEAWFERVNTHDAGIHAAVPWYSPELDDSEWDTTQLPGWLGDIGQGHTSGSVWLRKNLVLEDSDIGQSGVLYLGALVDADHTYINGHKVGHTGYQYPPRIYAFDTGILRAGNNEIVVRLTSHIDKIGAMPDKEYMLDTGAKRFDLTGQWKVKTGYATKGTAGWEFIHYKPGGLFNAMIAPASGTKLSGVIWYQGESNTSQPQNYQARFTSMIEDWRKYLKQPDLPFMFVQLANFMAASDSPQESRWAELREAQRQVNNQVEHTAMVVTIDVGEWNDIHPLDKKTVGLRLSRAARAMVYAEEVVYQGPEVVKAVRNKDKVVLTMEHVAERLVYNEVSAGWEIAAADKRFSPAQVSINGSQLQIWHQDIPNPAYIRYAWADNPQNASLKNSEGLPASPFEIAF